MPPYVLYASNHKEEYGIDQEGLRNGRVVPKIHHDHVGIFKRAMPS